MSVSSIFQAGDERQQRRKLEELIATLEQLLDVQDDSVLQQSEHLEATLRQLQRNNESLRRSQHEIARQSKVLQSILDQMSEGVVVVDAGGKFIQFNPEAEKIIGAGRMDVDVEEWSDRYALYQPDEETLFPVEELPLARAVQGEAVDNQEIFIRRQPDQPGIWVSVSARPLRGEDGKLRGGIALLRDITEEKKSLALLKRLSAVVEQTDDTVFITDRLGTILYVNPSFERTTGFSRDEAVGRTPRILKSGEHGPEVYKKLWKTIAAGKPYRGSMTNRRKNGKIFYCEQTITPMQNGNGRVTHFVSVLKDMTRRRRIQAQEFELRMASLVQKKLFPQQAPSWPEMDVAGSVVPAEATCGDYYDYIRVHEDRYGLALGDVSGHGLGPALVMAETRAYLRSLASTVKGMGPLFSRLNTILYSDLEDERFLTLLLLAVDPQSHHLCYANAGHLPGYILHANGEVKARLPATGPPLGMLENLVYQASDPVDLTPGDIVMALTDGITECAARGGEFFGIDRVLQTVREHSHLPAAQIIEAVFERASQFSRNVPQTDDMTMMVCKYRPEGMD